MNLVYILLPPLLFTYFLYHYPYFCEMIIITIGCLIADNFFIRYFMYCAVLIHVYHTQKDVKEQASQMVAAFKEECEIKIQGGRYYPKDLQIGKLELSEFIQYMFWSIVSRPFPGFQQCMKLIYYQLEIKSN